ncbi:unnamed protein product [Durusdinium trenchii]|uniref:DRBM domain-containing protein n=2 Tax=Durusdinium trenchii TaxID=1381693 RepID=A0ABP0PD82_9DINO
MFGMGMPRMPLPRARPPPSWGAMGASPAVGTAGTAALPSAASTATALPVGRIDNAAAVLNSRPEWAPPTLEPKDFSELDSKSQLALFCQKKLGQVFKQTDISYVNNKFDMGFQSIVKLTCLGGQEFAGELQTTASQAEQAAAKQAMEAFKEEVTQLGLDRMSAAQASKKRKGAEIEPGVKKQRLLPGILGEPGRVAADAGVVNTTSKMELNTHCSKIVRRVMEKSDVTYETDAVMEGGFQTKLRLSCLPGLWGSRVFVGEVQAKKGEAEQSVASIALAAIQSDADLMSKFSAPPKQKVRPPGMMMTKGKGKGKASAFNMPQMQVLTGLGIPGTGFW